MRSDLRRLHAMAKRRGVCAIHYTQPWCPVCDMVWSGSDAELEEVGELARRSRRDEPTVPTQPCTRCGAQALCLECFEVAHARMPQSTHDPLTPEERQRYDTLIKYLSPRRGTRWEARWAGK